MPGGGTIPVLRGVSPAPDIYAQSLSSAYINEWPIIDPDFSQQKDWNIWEKVRRDGKVAQAINLRTTAVASKDTTIEPAGEDEADEKLATFVQDAVDEIDDFREGRVNLANSVFRGRAYAYIEGSRRFKRLGDLGAREYWIPNRLRDVDKRRVQIKSRREGRRVRTTLELWHVGAEQYREIQVPQSFVCVKFGDEEARLRS